MNRRYNSFSDELPSFKLLSKIRFILKQNSFCIIIISQIMLLFKKVRYIHSLWYPIALNNRKYGYFASQKIHSDKIILGAI